LEVEHAVALNKRVVPLALRAVPDQEIPEEIRFRSWIPIGDGDFGQGLDRLVAALDADLEWERQHTRLTVRAVEWDQAGRDRSFLVRGSDLHVAERWQAAGTDKDPGPSGLEQEYLLASRQAASHRQRWLVGGSLGVTAVAIGLLIFALISRSQAVGAQSVSKSRALAAESTTELQSDPELSILLAMAAARSSPTPQALAALRDAIDASPVRGRLPPRGPQSCANSPGVAYSPAGGAIAEAACDGRAVLVDAANGRVRARWSIGHAAGPMAFSPDGRRLAVATQTGVAVLDASTGKTLERLVTESNTVDFESGLNCGSGPVGMPDSLAFNRDGGRLVASYNWNLDIWTLGRGAYPSVLGGPGSCIKSAAFDPSGRRIIVGDGRRVDVFDAANRRLEQTKAVLPVKRTPDPGRPVVTAVAISPDGRLAAVAGELNGQNISTVALWNTTTWTRVAQLVAGSTTPIDAISFSPDGGRVAIGEGDGAAGIWSVSTGRELLSLPGHVAPISSIAFSPDGRQLTTVSSDGEGLIWRATASSAGTAIATGAGRRLAKPIVAGDRVWAGVLRPRMSELRSWTMSGLPAGRFTTRAPPFTYAVGFSADGRLGAVEDDAGDILVRDLVHDRTDAVIPASDYSGLPTFHYPLVFALALDATGSRLAVSSDSGFGVFDLMHGVTAVAATTLPPCGVSVRGYVAFSANGRRVVAVSSCGEGILWDARSGKHLRTFNTGVSGVSAISLDTRGRLLALASPDRTVTVRNLNSNQTAYVLRGDTAPINDVAFSPTGTWIATASQDKEVRIWSAATGQLLRMLPTTSDVTSVSFSADGTRIVTTDSNGIIHVEDACSLCGNAAGLLRLGARRVSRQLTPAEQQTFGG
jgi:WD40 repeat protein